jgi:hypothetical protein
MDQPRLPTVEETPPEHRPVLLPVEKRLVEKLKQIFIPGGPKEFRLKGGTESLKAFVDLCFLNCEK